jgi:hypothetical protein
MDKENSNDKKWKEKGKLAMERISATGILNKDYPIKDKNSNYSLESQETLKILNKKFPDSYTKKGGKKKVKKNKTMKIVKNCKRCICNKCNKKSCI